MLSRLHIEDLRTIAHYLGSIVSFLAPLMALPLLMALILGERESALCFLYGIGAVLLVGTALRFVKLRPARLSAQHAIVVTGLSWLFVSLLGAIPLAYSGHYASFLDACFEAVSGFTTTGLTLVQDLDHMPLSMNMWRFLMELIGGQGILVAALAVGIYGKGGGSGNSAMALYSANAGSEHILPNIKQTAFFILMLSGVVIGASCLLMFVIMLVGGLEPLRAFLNGLWMSIGAFETGSFAPQSMGIMHYHSQVLEIAVLLVALLGIINYALYAELGKGNHRELFRNIETKTFALWTSAVLIMGVSAMAAGGALSSLDVIVRRGLFAFISAATNMGFSVMYPTQMSALLASGAAFAIVLGMLVGGSSNSTSGGIKAMRVGILFKSIADSLKQGLSPDSAVSNASYHHLNRKLLSPELASSALTITLMYLFTYVLGAVLGLMCGYDASLAVFESISATSNTGLSFGLLQLNTPAILKIFYMLQMWAGRLEFIMLFGVAYALLSSIPFDRMRQRLLRRWGKR